MENYYVKQYIPGYTGHVRKERFTFGITAGEINRRLALKEQPVEKEPEQRQYYTRCTSLIRDNRLKDKYNYQSRNAHGWICGPTYNLLPQHIPRISI